MTAPRPGWRIPLDAKPGSEYHGPIWVWDGDPENLAYPLMPEQAWELRPVQAKLRADLDRWYLALCHSLPLVDAAARDADAWERHNSLVEALTQADWAAAEYLRRADALGVRP